MFDLLLFSFHFTNDVLVFLQLLINGLKVGVGNFFENFFGEEFILALLFSDFIGFFLGVLIL